MNVDPSYNAVGQFFGYKPIYYVPKYQRGYAWDKPEIEDFLKDLEECFMKRLARTSVNHFFGGIVSVKKAVIGTVNQHSYELVDGQQRMATFVLLVSCMIKIYEEISLEATTQSDTDNVRIISGRISDLKQRYIVFEQEVNRRSNNQDVLTLSKADSQFFRDFLNGNNPPPTRDSHNKIKFAFENIFSKLKEFTDVTTINDKLDRLEILKNVLDTDFSILHVVTDDKKEAYKLFQVLNDRGKSLTEGDLLRAKTLELLEGNISQQTSIETIWDDILADKSTMTEDFLRWIFASYTGYRAGKNSLLDEFLDKFFPSHTNSVISDTDSSDILQKMQDLQNEIILCRKLYNGEWPFPSTRPITNWDRNRLYLLINELGHTLSIPLLLAACRLNHIKFASIVELLERFVFRYVIISNQHANPLQKVYHDESLAIRSNPSTYNINTLKTKLASLQSNANDTIFKTNLEALNYRVGGGNKPIKYFLMTLEHFLKWYRDGAIGSPECLDKSRVYDFTDTTIEHIYPRNSHNSTINTGLEPLKNTIGNLTFLGPNENVGGANDIFSIKKPIYTTSSVLMNREIGANSNWNELEVISRTNELTNIACKIFTV